jgi:PAS domain S-box-containing protein
MENVELSSSDSQALFQLLPVGMVLCRQRVITHINAEFAHIFGYETSALVGKSLEILYPTHSHFVERGERWREFLSSNGGHSDERIMMRSGDHPIRMRVRGRCRDRSNPYLQVACAFEPVEPSQALALSPREQDIVNAMNKGFTSKEIARILGLSHRTVETYRQRLMVKVGAKNAVQLLAMLR